MDKMKYEALEKLLAKIRANTASTEDYEGYRAMLVENGLSEEYVVGVLRRNGYSSLYDFIEQRKAAQLYHQKSNTESSALGSFLGMGSGLLMYWRVQSAGKQPRPNTSSSSTQKSSILA
jgi:hypothetical protein